jgi:hypothetical protein
MLTDAQRQVKEGIDAVIVDSVLAIRKGLTTGEEAGDTPRLSAEHGMGAHEKLESEVNKLELTSR